MKESSAETSPQKFRPVTIRSLQNAGTADFCQPTTWKGPLLGHPSSTTPPPLTLSDNETKEGIAFQLAEKPTATLTFTLQDSSDDSNIEWAFVAFSDPDDEYGEEFFPYLQPSQPFDGSYTVKVPGAEYKVEVMADGYTSVFYGVDASGSADWSSTSWEDGAAITLLDGETTALGTISLTAETTSEEDSIEWLDFGTEEDAPAGGTITGTVVTPDGSSVPRATIIAQTTDYLLWLDHVDTKSDGSFTLNKLPRGEWVIYALPPFESETYRGYQESNEIEVELEDGDSLTGQQLTLTASNVAGRVMYSKKQSDGTSKLVPLGRGFIWAFSDEDGDGYPDWGEEGEEDEFFDEFVELNKDGYFTLSLGSTGGYSAIVDLPPEHRAADPGAISFSVTNPSQLLNVGNAVEITWETKSSATGFSIERKAGTTGSYKSILSADLGSSVRSYVDSSVTPGESYTYRVTANLTSGSTVLDSSSVRQSSPFIYLAPPSKTIAGTVVDASGNTISGAEVIAFSERGFIETTTSTTGAYELNAGPGIWEVDIRPAPGSKASWVYDGFSEEVEFAKDSTTESITVNFEVTALGNGKITGKFSSQTEPVTGRTTSNVEVDAFNPEARVASLRLTKTAPLKSFCPRVATKCLFGWIPNSIQPTFLQKLACRVKDAEVALGDLTLGSISSKITGTLTDAEGTALPNFFVVAMNPKTVTLLKT